MGIDNAKAKGKHVGRPRVSLDVSEIARLRAQGLSWAKISQKLDVGEGTVRRAALVLARRGCDGSHISRNFRHDEITPKGTGRAL